MQITLMQKLLHMESTNKTHEFHVNPKILIVGICATISLIIAIQPSLILNWKSSESKMFLPDSILQQPQAASGPRSININGNWTLLPSITGSGNWSDPL